MKRLWSMRAMVVLLGITLAACPKRAGFSLGGRLAGLDEPSHRALFLGPEDLAGMTMRQDARTRGPDTGDRAFAEHQGVQAGLAVWQGAPDAALGRLVDVRWVFPSGKQARAYLKASRVRLAERQPPLPDAPLVGADCQVFGGDLKNPFGLRIVQYLYLFRVGNVVVKLYASQGPRADRLVLTTGHLLGVGEAAVKRISQNARSPR